MDMDNPTAERWLSAHLERVEAMGEVEFDVFVRSLSPPLGIRQRQEQLFSQLQELQSAGHIDSYRVNLWGGGVCLCDVCSGTSVAESMLDTVEEFEEWAADNEEMTLPFERNTVDSAVLEQTNSDLVVPSMCLSVRVETDIRGVFPCTVAGESISVTDYVEVVAEENSMEPEQADNHDPIAQL
jgi:hypothetical protein